MKKLKKLIKKHYKRAIISIVSLVSCFVMLSVPCLAADSDMQYIDVTHSDYEIDYVAIYENTTSTSWGSGVASLKGVKAPFIDNDNGVVKSYGFRYTGTTSYSLSNRTLYFKSKLPSSLTFQKNHKYRVRIPVVLFGLYDYTNRDVTLILCETIEKGTPNKYQIFSQTANTTFLPYSAGDSIDEGPSEYNKALFTVEFVCSQDTMPQYFEVGLKFGSSTFNWEYYNSVGFYEDVSFQDLGYVFGAPDTSASDEYTNVEGQINSANQAGINATNDMFTGFSGLLSGESSLSRGLMAATKIINGFLEIDFLDSLLNFALVLGIFAFFLGMGFFIGKSARGVDDSVKRGNQGYFEQKQNGRWKH